MQSIEKMGRVKEFIIYWSDFLKKMRNKELGYFFGKYYYNFLSYAEIAVWILGN